MRPKKRYQASLDQVRITRKGETAIIQYAESNLTIGPTLAQMSDQEILDVHSAAPPQPKCSYRPSRGGVAVKSRELRVES